MSYMPHDKRIFVLVLVMYHVKFEPIPVVHYATANAARQRESSGQETI